MTTVTRYKNVKATGPGPRLEITTNLANNPRAALSTDGIKFAGGSGSTYATRLYSSGGPLPECPSFVRMTWTAAQTSAVSPPQVYATAPDAQLIEGGETYGYGVYVRTSKSMPMSAKVGVFNGSTYLTAVSGDSVTVPANKWTRLFMTLNAPAAATRLQLNSDPVSSAPFFGIADTLDVTGWMLYKMPAGTPSVTLYGDGDQSGWEWLGPRHASPSKGFGSIA